ncbi:MAG: hypothetical protein AABZ55_01750 [Bdellovibrionota bacterium]
MKASKTPLKNAPKKTEKGGFLGKVIAAVKGSPAKKAAASPKSSGKMPAEPKVTSKHGPKSTAAMKGASKGVSAPAKDAGKKTALNAAPKAAQKSAAPVISKTAAPKAAPQSKKSGGKGAGSGFGVSLRKNSSDSHGEVCREVACEGLATTGVYCRMHYIKNWKKIKRKELILKEKKLNQYIEELVAKYPDKYIEAIRTDLANERDFSKVIHDLDLDEGIDEFNEEGENADSIVDSIKREFEDEGEGF